MIGKSTLLLSFSCESGKEWNSETCNGERWLDLSETDNLEPICYSEPALSVKVACTPVSKEVSLFCLKTLMIITVGQMSWRGVLILFKIDCDYPRCHRTLKRYLISAFSRTGSRQYNSTSYSINNNYNTKQQKQTNPKIPTNKNCFEWDHFLPLTAFPGFSFSHILTQVNKT